jgi:hypothetical protein
MNLHDVIFQNAVIFSYRNENFRVYRDTVMYSSLITLYFHGQQLMYGWMDGWMDG